MPDPSSDNPSVLYTMAQAAKYCNRSLAVFRKHYKNGMLPDPINTTVYEGKKIRLYTLAECKRLQALFESMRPGPKRKKRRRSQ